MSLYESILPKFGHNRQIMTRAIKALLESLPDLLHSIEDLSREKRGPEFKRALHKLKGSIAYFADDALYSLVTACEQSAEDLAPSELDKLFQEVEKLREQLQSIVTEVSPV